MSTTTETTAKSVISPADKARALKLVEGAKSTKALPGMECGKTAATIISSEIAQYQGKDSGLRFTVRTNTGVQCYSAIAPDSRAKAKILIESDSITEGMAVTLEVYELVDRDTKENKGNYCRIIL